MDKNSIYHPVSSPKSYADIIDNLNFLEKQLSIHDYDQFLVFNRSYVVVTQSIKDNSEKGYFMHPEFVEDFAITFAGYYFQAMNEVIANTTTESAAWGKLATAKKHPRFIQLLLGANAHINHDLPLVMVEHMNQDYSREVFKDILSIDALLMQSGKEIIPLLDESYTCQRFIKKHLQFLYYMPVMYMILLWRISAWRSYKSIIKNGLSQAKFQTKSVRTANRLFNIGLYLQF